MQDYINLQWKIINRSLDEFGVKPIWGFLLGTVLFAGFTVYLWYVTLYAPYFYALIGLGMTTLLHDPAKLTFIRQHFSNTQARQIRILENLLVAIPFIIGLLIHQEWLVSIVMFFAAAGLSMSNIQTSFQFVMPTPFYRFPFEFAVGFRKNIAVFLLATFLLIMAILYANPNLGLFAVALVELICLVFYMSSEPAYLVWIHHMKPTSFLWHKIKLAIWNITILVVPFAIAFSIFFPDHSHYLLIIYPLGVLYLVTALLGKYAFFPTTMNVPQGLLMTLSFGFPPMLLFMIPYFYRRCIHQLNPILP